MIDYISKKTNMILLGTQAYQMKIAEHFHIKLMDT